jgi:hypothetical protein
MVSPNCSRRKLGGFRGLEIVSPIDVVGETAAVADLDVRTHHDSLDRGGESFVDMILPIDLVTDVDLTDSAPRSSAPSLSQNV